MKDESGVNEHVIPLWRGQGEERYKTKGKNKINNEIKSRFWKYAVRAKIKKVVKDNLKDDYLEKEGYRVKI